MVDVTDTVRKAKKSESQDDDRRWHLSGAMQQQAKIVGQSENKVGKSGPNHETLAGCVDVQAVWTCRLWDVQAVGRAGCCRNDCANADAAYWLNGETRSDVSHCLLNQQNSEKALCDCLPEPYDNLSR